MSNEYQHYECPNCGTEFERMNEPSICPNCREDWGDTPAENIDQQESNKPRVWTSKTVLIALALIVINGAGLSSASSGGPVRLAGYIAGTVLLVGGLKYLYLKVKH